MRPTDCPECEVIFNDDPMLRAEASHIHATEGSMAAHAFLNEKLEERHAEHESEGVVVVVAPGTDDPEGVMNFLEAATGERPKAPPRSGRCMLCGNVLRADEDHSICDNCWPEEPDE